MHSGAGEALVAGDHDNVRVWPGVSTHPLPSQWPQQNGSHFQSSISFVLSHIITSATQLDCRSGCEKLRADLISAWLLNWHINFRGGYVVLCGPVLYRFGLEYNL